MANPLHHRDIVLSPASLGERWRGTKWAWWQREDWTGLAGADWRESVVTPLVYAITPPFTGLSEVLKIVPDSAETHFNWGTTLTLVGDNAGAIEHFREALRLKPDFPAASESLQQIEGQPARPAKPPKP